MIWTALGLGIVGLSLSAFFSGAETGFYRATRLRLVLDAVGGDWVARGLLVLANHPALVVATTLVGNSLANYLVSLATVMGVLAMFPGSPPSVELAAALGLAPFLLVYGELLPKNLSLQAPNRLLRRWGPLLLVFVVVFSPIAGLVWALSRLFGRLLGDSSEPVRATLARRELRRILEEGHEAGILHPAQRSLAHGIFAVARQPVSQFVVPLAQLPLARATMTKHEVLELAERTRTAILPVESAGPAGTLAGCVRVIDLRLSDSEEVRPVRPLLELGDETTHLEALMRMESTGESLARVVNLQGETIGIVTIRRLREPLF